MIKDSKPPISARERRLQEALRENLRKRKAQSRESKAEASRDPLADESGGVID